MCPPLTTCEGGFQRRLSDWIPACAGITTASFAIPGLTRYPVKRNVASGDTLFIGFLLLALLCTTTTTANEILARQNYILNCQGCHLPDGSGSEGNVPKMNDFVGYFLHVPGGREFIVQVPGAAGAPISDQELADVMNWMLLNFSRNQLPDPFVPYEAEEIGELRKDPLIDIHHRREELIARIKDKLGVTEY
ncbi:MAG: cytochrome c [Gammaproteobacteria bacterium]|nr:cytochrome c [Gammaproteobacteria bacterium]